MMSLKEYILEVISNSYVFEMAYDRKELKKRVESLLNQIIENWCLVRYCSLYDKNNININHWRRELQSHLFNIFEMSIKGGNYNSKYNLISEIIFNKREITTSNKISLIIRNKFRIEGIVIKSDICEGCLENLKELISLISNKETPENSDELFDYIDRL